MGAARPKSCREFAYGARGELRQALNWPGETASADRQRAADAATQPLMLAIWPEFIARAAQRRLSLCMERNCDRRRRRRRWRRVLHTLINLIEQARGGAWLIFILPPPPPLRAAAHFALLRLCARGGDGTRRRAACAHIPSTTTRPWGLRGRSSLECVFLHKSLINCFKITIKITLLDQSIWFEIFHF